MTCCFKNAGVPGDMKTITPKEADQKWGQIFLEKQPDKHFPRTCKERQEGTDPASSSLLYVPQYCNLFNGSVSGGICCEKSSMLMYAVPPPIKVKLRTVKQIVRVNLVEYPLGGGNVIARACCPTNCAKVVCHMALHFEAFEGKDANGQLKPYAKDHPDYWSWEVGVDLNGDGCAGLTHTMCTGCGLYSTVCCCTPIHIATEKPFWHIMPGDKWSKPNGWTEGKTFSGYGGNNMDNRKNACAAAHEKNPGTHVNCVKPTEKSKSCVGEALKKCASLCTCGVFGCCLKCCKAAGEEEIEKMMNQGITYKHLGDIEKLVSEKEIYTYLYGKFEGKAYLLGVRDCWSLVEAVCRQFEIQFPYEDYSGRMFLRDGYGRFWNACHMMKTDYARACRDGCCGMAKPTNCVHCLDCLCMLSIFGFFFGTWRRLLNCCMDDHTNQKPKKEKMWHGKPVARVEHVYDGIWNAHCSGCGGNCFCCGCCCAKTEMSDEAIQDVLSKNGAVAVSSSPKKAAWK